MFFLAGLCEIGGGYLVWLWLREDFSFIVGAAGGFVLFLYGKFIIVDLSSGTSDDITSFLGSIILHMIYVEAKKRVDNTQQLAVPFYIYIDEAHLFSPFALREILNTMRKFNVKVTLATQTINAYPKRVADEIPALARTILCFKCDTGTAHMFRNLLPLGADEMVGL
ncbi:putative BCR protein, partial [Marine Group I thaumarchaeote SCGC AAA799-P11]